jgi:hypothetical protein
MWSISRSPLLPIAHHPLTPALCRFHLARPPLPCLQASLASDARLATPQIGRAVRASGVPRGELFLTSKAGPSEMSFSAALRAASASLERLGTGYLDLYLLHWPGCARTPPDSRRHREARQAHTTLDANLAQQGNLTWTELLLNQLACRRARMQGDCDRQWRSYSAFCYFWRNGS